MDQRENDFLTALYHRNIGRLYQYVAHACRAKGVSPRYQAQVAEDIVQDTFHTASEKIHIVSAHPSPDAWLMTVCKFKFQEYMRRLRIDKKYLLFLAAMSEPLSAPNHGMEDPEAWLNYTSDLSQIQQLLSAEDYRLFELLILRRVSHATAAKALGISVWASQKRICRIRERLQSLLTE